MTQPKHNHKSIQLIAILLMFVLVNCNTDYCATYYDEATCKRIREKSDALNKIISEYSKQKDHLIRDFHSFQHGYKQNKIVCDSVDVYIDRSKGMKEMILSLQENNIWGNFVNTIRSSRTNYFFVQGGQTPHNYVVKSDAIPGFDQLMNESFYQEWGSPLDSAISKIIRNTNRQSIFITDGELARQEDNFFKVDGNSTIINQGEAWAKDMIASWLREGNIIDVFISSFYSYSAKDTMRGFIFVFTPVELKEDSQSIKSKIISNLKIDRHEGIHHLHFSFHDYMLEKVISGASLGFETMNENFVEEFTKSRFLLNHYPEYRFDHYHLMYPVKDFHDFFQNLRGGRHDDRNRDESQLRKLFDNLKFSLDCLVFDSVKLGLRFYNIDEGISELILSRKLQWVDTISSEVWGTIYCIEDFNFPHKLPDFNVTKSINLVRNCFSLVTNANQRIDTLIIAAGIVEGNFNFSDFKTINNFKLDIVIEELFTKHTNPQLAMLRWKNHSLKEPVMDGLYKSFVFAYSENKTYIKEKPVFTFYLTTN